MPLWACIGRFRALFAAAAVAGLGLSGCSEPAAPTDAEFASLVDRIGRDEIGRLPEEADMIGVAPEVFGGPYDSQLDDRSMAADQRSRAARLETLAQLEAFGRSNISRETARQLDTLLFVYRAAAAMDRYGYGHVRLGWASPYVINPIDGAYTDLVKFLTSHHPIRSRSDAEAWLVRLSQMNDAMRHERRRLEMDISAGAVPPRAILQRTLNKVRSLQPRAPREHTLVLFLVESLAKVPNIPESDIRVMADRAAAMIGGDIAAEYRELVALLEDTLPRAHDEPGVWRLNGGDAYYRDAVRLYTTTELSPAQLHQAGEQLVADITTEMDALLIELGQEEGTVAQRMAALASDPAYLFPDTPEGQAAVLATIEEHIKQIEPKLSEILQSGPKGSVEIRQAPPTARDTAPAAYYKPAAVDGSRPATYNLNLQSASDWPIWALATLSYHEAAPGHHIQAGLAREKSAQPVINFLMAHPAFAEGWAVYAEDLADELGMYEADKPSRLGYLQALLFRAARLVADTGIHAERWSRETAISYLVETTGLPRAQMENEVDRYTVRPGHALSYMAGRETIRRLRKSAQQELGAQFDLRLFHNAVLSPGPRPLPVLEQDIIEWIASRRPQPPAE